MDQLEGGRETLAVIEIKHGKVVFKKESFSTKEEARDQALLRQLSIPAKTVLRAKLTKNSDTLPLPNREDFTNAIVVFGGDSDPLLPFDQNFDLTVSMLKLLSQANIQELYFQTRSPIILILLPLLQSFGRKLRVVIGLESIDDCLSRELLPDLPLASDRIRAARVLSKFQIRVIVQTTQLPHIPYPGHLSKQSAVIINEVAYAVRVLPFARLFGVEPCQHTASYMCVEGIIEELQQVCPQKILLCSESSKREAA